MIKVKRIGEMKIRRELETAESGEPLFRSGRVFASRTQYSA
jgi:hypothetical protein